MLNEDIRSKVICPSAIGDYNLRGLVGDGSFSIVKLAFSTTKHEYYACKIIPRDYLREHNLEYHFEHEIRIIQRLSHPGIVQLYDILKDENNYYVVMEFCPNGELFSLIVEKHYLPEDEAKGFFVQILEAIQYVHKNGIAHRDLKPENILLDQTGHIKVSDFGLSCVIGEDGMASTPCGSPCYASPEVLSGAPYDAKASDVWSLGVILFAMLTGQLPWTKRNQNQLFDQIRRGEYTIPDDLSDECQSILTGLLCVDINSRLTIEEALNHPWLRSQNTNNIIELQMPVSLRHVDEFFYDDENEKPINEIHNQLLIRKNQSTPFMTIVETLKEIGKDGFRVRKNQ